MKKTLKILGIIAITAMFVFGAVSCKESAASSGSGGSLTITGLDKYNGNYAFAWLWNDDIYLFAAVNVDIRDFEENDITFTGGKITGGQVTLKVWKLDGDSETLSNYNGSDTVDFGVTIVDQATINATDDDAEDHVKDPSDASTGAAGGGTVTFANGVGKGVFKKAD